MKENAGELLGGGGAKGMLPPPPSQIIGGGGAGPPPPSPLPTPMFIYKEVKPSVILYNFCHYIV